MAKRRCISADFYDSDLFGKLSSKTKVLYTHFILHSDDDGVVINPKVVLRITKANKKHLDELFANNLLIRIDDIIVIRHWYVHNKVQPARKVDSIYQSELAKLCINERREYELVDDNLSTNNRPNITKPNLTKNNRSKVNSNEYKSGEGRESYFLDENDECFIDFINEEEIFAPEDKTAVQKGLKKEEYQVAVKSDAVKDNSDGKLEVPKIPDKKDYDARLEAILAMYDQ